MRRPAVRPDVLDLMQRSDNQHMNWRFISGFPAP
jgi:hypothetical protein